MRLGLSTYDIEARDLVHLAAAADMAGFESLWLGEHVVVPRSYASEHPTSQGGTVQHHTGPIVDPSTVLLDPLVALAGAGASSARIGLATGIYLLTLRHPILAARAVSTLQGVCEGRFLLGLGAGWLREEFDALGVSFEDRGSRFDESIDVLTQLLAGGEVHHDGPHFSFAPLELGPVAREVPIILGGNVARALRRAAVRADGWFSSGTPSFEEACDLRDRIDRACQAAGRTRPLPLWFRAATPEPAELDRYRAAGFERVVVWADQLWPKEGPADERREAFSSAVDRYGLHVPDDLLDRGAPTGTAP